MKKIIFLMLGLLLSFQSFSQWEWPYISFDDSTYSNYITIDTLSNPDNTWQVGPPSKPNFTQAYSQPNALVTDTIQPYPINDTSVFYIRYITPENIWGAGWVQTTLNFRYRVDMDENLDFGKIEFSPDNGQLWIDFVNDSIYNNNYYLSSDPLFTGTSNSWNQFGVYIEPYSFGINDGDTVLYKFTFISDEIQNEKDGWIIDDIYLGDTYEGIGDLDKNKIVLRAYPNPVINQTVNFQLPKNEFLTDIELACYNIFGELMFQKMTNQPQDEIEVSTAGWKPGFYVAMVKGKNGIVGECKFIVE